MDVKTDRSWLPTAPRYVPFHSFNASFLSGTMSYQPDSFVMNICLNECRADLPATLAPQNKDHLRFTVRYRHLTNPAFQ